MVSTVCSTRCHWECKLMKSCARLKVTSYRIGFLFHSKVATELVCHALVASVLSNYYFIIIITIYRSKLKLMISASMSFMYSGEHVPVESIFEPVYWLWVDNCFWQSIPGTNYPVWQGMFPRFFLEGSLFQLRPVPPKILISRGLEQLRLVYSIVPVSEFKGLDEVTPHPSLLQRW